jgi:hypothetical protein
MRPRKPRFFIVVVVIGGGEPPGARDDNPVSGTGVGVGVGEVPNKPLCARRGAAANSNV